ncbi:carboxylesterase family protein [Streptococcus sp. S784/96/1]|uniref:carboxylesterase family protein n=1 Tax=Streptococcus sp. S784/96/1 TaxID=2653499 RepID=UPI00138716A6|nr:carboxylesterase family protein [Streptococcus sp. S784/96/1]
MRTSVFQETTFGRVQGTSDGVTERFAGLRYAHAQRYGIPQPFSYEGGVIDATKLAPIAAQPNIYFKEYYFKQNYSSQLQTEHPQILSIYRPIGTTEADQLPVMIWIHGGAFTNGSGESSEYTPDLLVSQEQVMVVNISYRLGVLGYLRDQAGHLANLGLLDQIEAIKWVKSYIAQFGGNPDQLTLFGQSAGAESVRAILLADGTEGLVQRAIIQSAPIGAAQVDRSAMSQEMLDKLLELPLEAPLSELLAKQVEIEETTKVRGLARFMKFGPHYGVYPLPSLAEIPARLDARAKELTLFIGSNTREVASFLPTQPKILGLSDKRLGRKAIKLVVKKLSREIFNQPALDFAQAYAQAGGQVYHYSFSWQEEAHLVAAGHDLELPLLFNFSDFPDSPFLLGKSWAETLIDGQPLRQVWGQFARTGQVDLAGIPLMLEINQVK